MAAPTRSSATSWRGWCSDFSRSTRRVEVQAGFEIGQQVDQVLGADPGAGSRGNPELPETDDVLHRAEALAQLMEQRGRFEQEVAEGLRPAVAGEVGIGFVIDLQRGADGLTGLGDGAHQPPPRLDDVVAIFLVA